MRTTVGIKLFFLPSVYIIPILYLIFVLSTTHSLTRLLLFLHELLLDLDATIEYIKMLFRDPNRMFKMPITPVKGSDAATEG